MTALHHQYFNNGNNTDPYMLNWYPDQDGRSFSPEQRQRSKMSPQSVAVASIQDNGPNPRSDNEFGIVPENKVSPALAPHVVVAPTATDVGFVKRQTRGWQGTGRWQNLGPAPADGFSIGFDYWEKILLSPDRADLGNVVSDTQFDVTIRNTFRRDNKQITLIDNNAGAGISVVGAVPPANLAPLFDKTYVILVTTDGPPNINGTVDWTVTTGILTLTITGTRIIIFPNPPESNVQEKLKWMTDVIKSADGTEQRHALREFPRQSVVYEIVTTTIENLNSVRNLMIGWTSRVFGVPLWWYERAIVEDVLVNDLTIFVRTDGLDYADFRVGGLAMIFQENPDGTRITNTLQIQTVVNAPNSPESLLGSITFETAIQDNFDADLATVVPVIAAILASPADMTTPAAGDTARFNLNFQMLDNASVVPGVDNAWYPELDDFDGTNTIILTDRSMLAGTNLSEKFEQKLQRVDFNNGGTFRQLSQELLARRSTPFKWVAETVPFEWQLRSLLFNLRGKLRNIWIPTWRQDFEVVTNIGNGSSTIDVANWGFTAYVDGVSPWSGCRLLHTDGSTSYHRITASDVISETVERLTIDPVTPFAALIPEVERLDLMILTRMATDEVNILHKWSDAETNDLDSEVTTSFIGDVQT